MEYSYFKKTNSIYLPDFGKISSSNAITYRADFINTPS